MPLCVSCSSHRHAQTVRRILRHASSTYCCTLTSSPADRLGNTPLHLAVDSAHAQTAALLIDVGGADRNRVNTDGLVAEQMEGVGGVEQKRVREFLAQSFGALG